MCAARKQAEAAITRPGRPGVRDRALAQARAQLGAANPALAIQTLRPLIRKGKADGEALYLTGVAYRAGGDLVSATDYARRSIKAVDNAHARLLLASCLRAKGETEKCVAACDAAMAAPALAEQAMALKGAALEEAGRFDEARP